MTDATALRIEFGRVCLHRVNFPLYDMTSNTEIDASSPGALATTIPLGPHPFLVFRGNANVLPTAIPFQIHLQVVKSRKRANAPIHPSRICVYACW